MAIQTDLSVSPYFDDFEVTNNYYRVLFRPGVSVQVRELNQIQAIQQNQIESFADNIYKNGTLIDGGAFQFYPDYSYVKLLDIDTDGLPFNPTLYNEYFIKDGDGLVASINEGKSGFVSTAPDLNTLYVRYLNSGDSAEKTAFSSGVLTIFDADYPIEEVLITNGGVGFSNNDTVQIVPSLQINVTSGTFVANDIPGTQIVQKISDGVYANLIVKSVISAPDATANQYILQVRPITGDLYDPTLTSSKWTVNTELTVTHSDESTWAAEVDQVFGSGGRGVIQTDSAGVINTIAVADAGSGYEYTPHATVRSTSQVGVENLVIEARNYVKKVTVAGTDTNPVGNGYAFAITEGTVYLNGQFLTVNPQTVIVEKYNPTPDSKIVGLQAIESIVNTATDSTLYDNASGSLNFAAPGADRLKIEPTLVVSDRETALDPDETDAYFILCEFDAGKPTKQHTRTQYSDLNDQQAARHDDITGDYVLDPFRSKTVDVPVGGPNTTHVSLSIDPGTAYINGRKVLTHYNTNIPLEKGTATASNSSITGAANYGNYIRVTNLLGTPNVQSGQTVSLKDFAVGTNATSSGVDGTGTSAFGDDVDLDTTAGGKSSNQVGTARIRSVSRLASDKGNAISHDYAVFLYDVRLESGKSFADAKGIAEYNPANTSDCTAVADIVLEIDATSDVNIAKLQDTGEFNRLVFDTGLRGLKTANSITYTYNKKVTASMGANGFATLPTLSGGEVYPYNDGALSDIQLNNIIVSPTSNVTTGWSGTGSANALTSGLTAGDIRIPLSGTDIQPEDIRPGDVFLMARNTSGGTYQQFFVNPVSANSTFLELDLSDPRNSLTVTNNVNDFFAKKFLSGEQINLAVPGRGATVSGSGTVMSIDARVCPVSLTDTTDVADIEVIVPVKKTVSAATKTVTRQAFVKIEANTHTNTTTGPWCIGVPDIIRLRKVYRSANSTVDTTSEDVTQGFMVDNGQKSNYYGLGYLYALPNRGITIAADDTLLVEYDCFTGHAAGDVYTVASYPINDVLPLANNAAAINTLEIPEFIDPISKEYFDLRDAIDYRPVMANTVLITQDDSTAPSNPSTTETPITGAIYAPKPGDDFEYDASWYLGHTDSIELDDKGNFKLNRGQDLNNKVSIPPSAEGVMRISTVIVPPYPSIPTIPSNNNIEYLDARVGTAGTVVDYRRRNFTCTIPSNEYVRETQPRRYTMRDIGQLERRVKALEYYQTLSQLEIEILKSAIPSAVTPSVSRFKAGFLVEGFDNDLTADTQHPEYNAEIHEELSELEVEKDPISINLKFNKYEPTTGLSLINKYGFREDGRLLISESRTANSDSIDYIAMLPFTYDKVTSNERRNTSTPKIVPKNQFGGRLYVTPTTFDIGTRVRLYRRQ